MEISERIERMAYLTNRMSEDKAELDRHKAFFETQAEETLRDSKSKSVDWLADAGKITVTEAASVKVLNPSILKRLFGEAYGNFVKEETKTDIKQAGVKRTLAAIFNGEYVDVSPAEVINQITDDEKTRAALKKKLKGTNFKKDSDNIMTLTGCDREYADDMAFLFAEAVTYDAFNTYTELDFDEAVNQLRRAIIVDESIKVALEEM